MEADVKYPVLMTVSSIQIIVGWIAVVIGIIMVLMGLAGVANGQQNPYGAMAGMAQLTSGFAIAIAGLFVVHAGELSKVITDIEANTARSADALRAAFGTGQSSTPAASAVQEAAETTTGSTGCAHTWQLVQEDGTTLRQRCTSCGAPRTYSVLS